MVLASEIVNSFNLITINLHQRNPLREFLFFAPLFQLNFSVLFLDVLPYYVVELDFFVLDYDAVLHLAL